MCQYAIPLLSEKLLCRRHAGNIASSLLNTGFAFSFCKSAYEHYVSPAWSPSVSACVFSDDFQCSRDLFNEISWSNVHILFNVVKRFYEHRVRGGPLPVPHRLRRRIVCELRRYISVVTSAHAINRSLRVVWMELCFTWVIRCRAPRSGISHDNHKFHLSIHISIRVVCGGSDSCDIPGSYTVYMSSSQKRI